MVQPQWSEVSQNHGPLDRHLKTFPMKNLVTRPWGDLSQEFHDLLGLFAKTRAEVVARSKGREGGPGAGELGQVMGEVRRAMSVQVVRGQALCLLERLAQLGPGARAAGERRKVGGGKKRAGTGISPSPQK